MAVRADRCSSSFCRRTFGSVAIPPPDFSPFVAPASAVDVERGALGASFEAAGEAVAAAFADANDLEHISFSPPPR